MLFVPESPRWLTVHDGHDDARKALTKLVFPGCTGLIQRGDAFTSEEFEYELFEFSKLSAQRKELATTIGILDVFKGSDLRRTLLCFAMIAPQTGSGV